LRREVRTGKRAAPLEGGGLGNRWGWHLAGDETAAVVGSASGTEGGWKGTRGDRNLLHGPPGWFDWFRCVA